MKVTVANNRVMELTGTQLRMIVGAYLSEPVRMLHVDGKEVTETASVEVRWSDPAEEREV